MAGGLYFSRAVATIVTQGTKKALKAPCKTDANGNSYVECNWIWKRSGKVFLGIALLSLLSGGSLMFLDRIVSLPFHDFSGGEFLVLFSLAPALPAIYFLRSRMVLEDRQLVLRRFFTRKIPYGDIREGAVMAPPEIVKGNSIRFYLPGGKKVRLTLFLMFGACDFVQKLGVKTKLDLESFSPVVHPVAN